MWARVASPDLGLAHPVNWPGFLFLKVQVLNAESSISPKAQVSLVAWQARSGLAILLMFASGACGLVWQMAWTAQFGFALGHEIVAVLSVVAAFFGGISIFSLWRDPII